MITIVVLKKLNAAFHQFFFQSTAVAKNIPHSLINLAVDTVPYRSTILAHLS